MQMSVHRTRWYNVKMDDGCRYGLMLVDFDMNAGCRVYSGRVLSPGGWSYGEMGMMLPYIDRWRVWHGPELEGLRANLNTRAAARGLLDAFCSAWIGGGGY